jgi:hypothetical protein
MVVYSGKDIYCNSIFKFGPEHHVMYSHVYISEAQFGFNRQCLSDT